MLLPKRDRKRIFLIVVLQICLGFLDLLGIIFIGILSIVFFEGVSANNSNIQTNWLLNFLNLNGVSLNRQIAVLGICAFSFLTVRSIVSLLVTKRILLYFSLRAADISRDLLSRLLAQPFIKLQSKSTQEMAFSVTLGVEYLVMQVLATSIIWIADASLLVFLILGLAIADVETSLLVLAMFFLIGSILYNRLRKRSEYLGRETARIHLQSNERVVEVLSMYRELAVKNRRHFYVQQLSNLRQSYARVSAEASFMPYVSKYSIEFLVLISCILVGVFQLLVNEGPEALAVLAVFFAAATRIAPAVLRLQHGAIAIKNGIGVSNPTLELIENLPNRDLSSMESQKLDFYYPSFRPEVELEEIYFRYPERDPQTIVDLSLRIPRGLSVAIIGSSGAGKTTLLDIILGLIEPDRGSVRISGMHPLIAISKWPGAISYIPQEVAIFVGTIRENVAAGFPLKFATDEKVINALKIAQLYEFVMTLPDGLDTHVSEWGGNISGGQRQRLGIARAMFTNPLLLVLDEATSALDSETENKVTEAIKALRGSVTTITVAHRLSTISTADLVLYLHQGKILASGSFEEVRSQLKKAGIHTRLGRL